jgi:hypothetical protein
MARKRQPLTLADLPPHWRKQAIEQLGLKQVQALPDIVRTEAKVIGETVLITLPHPRGTSPNDRLHHHAKAKAIKALRSTVADAVILAGADMGWTEATAQVHVYYRRRTAADRDNWIARLKGAFDGLQDAGLIVNDNGLHVGDPVIDVDQLRPRVEIRVTHVSRDTWVSDATTEV